MGPSILRLFNIAAAGQCVPGSAGYHTFFGLLPWYQYLDMNSQCDFDPSHPFVLLGAHSGLLLIGLAVVDDLLRLAGILAVLFVVYSGVMFIQSNGAPDATAKARTAGINSLVGLAITMVAITFVSFIGNQIGGTGQGGTAARGLLDLGSLPNPAGAESGSLIQTGLSVAFGIIGALAFLIIVIAGMRYMLAQGDPSSTAQAKNTIIYALVGLVIAILAESIVSLAVSR
jgi:hypothetical protein